MKERSVHVALAVLFAIITIALASCVSTEENVEQSYKELNLIPLANYSRKLVNTGKFDFESHLTSFHLPGGGWSRPFKAEEEERLSVAAVLKESFLRYSVFKPADRWLSLKARLTGDYGDLDNQQITVLAGNQELARFELSGEAEKELRVFIPADVQVSGVNGLIFRFAGFSDDPRYMKTGKKRRNAPYKGVAAYFSEIKLQLGDGNGDDLAEIRPAAESVAVSEDARFLRQFPESAVTFALDLEQNHSLAFSGYVDIPEPEDAPMTVALSIRTDREPEWRTAWERQIQLTGSQAAPSIEGTLPLSDFDANRAEIRFTVDSGERSRSSVVWRKISLTYPPASGENEAMDNPAIEHKSDVKNVIILVLDALRADHLGVYGDDRNLTPNIDEFARDAIVFNNAVAPAPYTIASVSSIFSGVLPEVHGVRKGLKVFPKELTNMAGAFKRNGCYTGVMAGLPFVKRSYGITRDCDFEIYLRRQEDRKNRFSTMNLKAARNAIMQAGKSDKPVFMYAHFLPPHWPYRPPLSFMDEKAGASALDINRNQIREGLSSGSLDGDSGSVKEIHRHYMNNVRYADYVFNEVVGYLKEANLFEDSLIIVMADHGEAFGDHRNLGHSSTIYDETIWVPFIVRIPGVEPHRVGQQVGLVDIFPTLNEMMGLGVDPQEFNGRSLAPLFNGEQQPPEGYYYSRAVDNAKRVEISRIKFTLRGERYKYIFNDFVDELYDLKNDPGESENIIADMPVLAAILRQRGLSIAIGIKSASREDADLRSEEEEELRNLGYLQ